jgi:calcium-dependent protein kinase
LGSAFLRGKRDDQIDMDSKTFYKLLKFKGESMFKRAALNILVKMATEEETQELKMKFEAIDTNRSGSISLREIKTWLLTQKKIVVTDDLLKKMIDELDYIKGGEGEINFSEFLAATLDEATFFTEQKLRAVFGIFDAEKDGKVNE